MIQLYIANILITIDRLANVLLGGDRDETLSSRMHDCSYWPCLIICWLLGLIDPNHCYKSFKANDDPDKGAEEIWRWK